MDNKKFLTLTAVVIVVLFSITSHAENAESAGVPPSQKVYAVWYMLGENTSVEVVRADMKKIAAIGFNTVMFPAYVTQKNVSSLEVAPPGEKYLKSLEQGIDAARGAGLKVSMTAFLLVGDGAWRGTIMPVQYKKWTVSYIDAITPHLKLAAREKIESFCIGSEMESMKKKADVWRHVIQKAREIYKGPLGFNTNWWSGATDAAVVLNQMGWLVSLDFIGVSGYFELTKSDSPTRVELAAAWSGDAHGQNVLKDFASLKNKFPNQKLYLWEIGYRSQDGTNKSPWNWGREAQEDPAEQADCFAAFLSVFHGSALDGFSIWALNPELKPTDTSYDFYGKPAQTEFEKFFLITHETKKDYK